MPSGQRRQPGSESALLLNTVPSEASRLKKTVAQFRCFVFVYVTSVAAHAEKRSSNVPNGPAASPSREATAASEREQQAKRNEPQSRTFQDFEWLFQAFLYFSRNFQNSQGFSIIVQTPPEFSRIFYQFQGSGKVLEIFRNVDFVWNLSQQSFWLQTFSRT